MHSIVLLILSLFISFSSYAQDPVAAPKYSSLKKLTNLEVAKALEVYTGRDDTWKNRASLLMRAKGLVPFQRKTTVEEERTYLSFVYARKTPNALTQYTLKASQSQHPEIKGMIATVQGDKHLVYNAYTISPSSDLRGLLLFFRSLEYGDTGLETKKYRDFARAFTALASEIQRAYKLSSSLQLPLVIEFESSALIANSPLTRMFFNTLVSSPERILKAEITPNQGRLVAIHPFYAKDVVEHLNLFTKEFALSVETLKRNLFRDPQAKQRLIELVQRGQGVSGLLYTSERIQETGACKSVFN